MKRKVLGPPVVACVSVSVVLLFSACDSRGPSAPSPAATPVSSSPAPPAPDLSKLAGVWNVTVRLTTVTGNGCVAETMRSQIGEPQPYLLSITPQGTVTLTKGDRACAFTPIMGSAGFTTYGKGGTYACTPWSLDFTCGDGRHHAIFTFGEDISGEVSGNAISGAWDAVWVSGWGDDAAETKAQFTGTRQ